MTHRLTLGIDSDLRDVSMVAVAVNSVCIYLGMDKTVASHVELCAVEAVTNAIQHAYHGQSGHAVSVVITSEIDRLELEIVDSGTPMPDEQMGRLLHGANGFEAFDTPRDLLAESGRGLQIMHDLMDAVAYTPGATYNRLRLTRLIPYSRFR
jgi:serine/threonine-protein kinase RsbW